MISSNLPFNLSPKVANPAITLAAIGVGLVVLGLLLKDNDLKKLGYGALGAIVPLLGVGYKSDVGDVVEPIGPPSDSLLPADALAKMDKEPVVNGG